VSLLDESTRRGRDGPENRAGLLRPHTIGHTIETNRDGHKLRQVAVPQVGEPIGDTEF
jgi:hypothetical protein